MKPQLPGIVVGLLLAGPALPAAAEEKPAQEQKQAETQAKDKKQEWIYGRQMMTREEIAEYRSKMHAAKSAEEREKIREEHHKKMVERAKERGVAPPEEPPARPGRMGPGGGMGSGRGYGGGY